MSAAFCEIMCKCDRIIRHLTRSPARAPCACESYAMTHTYCTPWPHILVNISPQPTIAQQHRNDLQTPWRQACRIVLRDGKPRKSGQFPAVVPTQSKAQPRQLLPQRQFELQLQLHVMDGSHSICNQAVFLAVLKQPRSRNNKCDSTT